MSLRLGLSRGVLGLASVRQASRVRPSTRPSFVQRRQLHKNEFMEEWNGLREDTHKAFRVNSSNIGSIMFLVVLFPGLLYGLLLEEENVTGQRKYMETRMEQCAKAPAAAEE